MDSTGNEDLAEDASQRSDFGFLLLDVKSGLMDFN